MILEEDVVDVIVDTDISVSSSGLNWSKNKKRILKMQPIGGEGGI